jgi:hypothetical protein
MNKNYFIKIIFFYKLPKIGKNNIVKISLMIALIIFRGKLILKFSF